MNGSHRCFIRLTIYCFLEFVLELATDFPVNSVKAQLCEINRRITQVLFGWKISEWIIQVLSEEEIYQELHKYELPKSHHDEISISITMLS